MPFGSRSFPRSESTVAAGHARSPWTWGVDVDVGAPVMVAELVNRNDTVKVFEAVRCLRVSRLSNRGDG
jgi:hypothetical protein